jgi:hypothetical protein
MEYSVIWNTLWYGIPQYLIISDMEYLITGTLNYDGLV